MRSLFGFISAACETYPGVFECVLAHRERFGVCVFDRGTDDDIWRSEIGAGRAHIPEPAVRRPSNALTHIKRTHINIYRI